MIGMSLVIPFLPLYLTQLHVPDSQLELWAGWIGGANFLLAAIFAPVWGTLADRFGLQAPLLIQGGIALLAGIVAFGLAETNPRILAGRAQGAPA